MKFKISIFMLLSGYLALTAAADSSVAETAFQFKDDEIVTVDLIIQKYEASCKRKKAEDALRWYCALELFIYADCEWLDQYQVKAWRDIAPLLLDDVRSISSSFIPMLQMDIDMKVAVKDVLLEKVKKDQVKVDLSIFLGGYRLPADAQIKPDRITELEKIRIGKKSKRCTPKFHSAFF